jgi:hypothetical protein
VDKFNQNTFALGSLTPILYGSLKIDYLKSKEAEIEILAKGIEYSF